MMSSTEQICMPELRDTVSRGQRLLLYTDGDLRPAADVATRAWALYAAGPDGHWNLIGHGATLIETTSGRTAFTCEALALAYGLETLFKSLPR